MDGVVDPLFSHIALNDPGQQHRQRVGGEYQAEWRGDRKERKDVFQLGADVLAVVGTFVMLPMERIQVLISPALIDFPAVLRDLESPVKDIAVGEIFHERPEGDPGQVEGQGQVGVGGSKGQDQQDDGVSGIEGSHRVEDAPGNRGLLALVNAEALRDRALILKLRGQEMSRRHEIKAFLKVTAVLEQQKFRMKWLA